MLLESVEAVNLCSSNDHRSVPVQNQQIDPSYPVRAMVAEFAAVASIMMVQVALARLKKGRPRLNMSQTPVFKGFSRSKYSLPKRE